MGGSTKVVPTGKALGKPGFPQLFLSKRGEPDGILNHQCIFSTLISAVENYMTACHFMKNLRLYKISGKQKHKDSAPEEVEMYLRPTANALIAAGTEHCGHMGEDSGGSGEVGFHAPVERLRL